MRAGPWRMLVPLRAIERVHGAALPARAPGGGAPVVSVEGALLPVVFAEALLGSPEATLAPDHQLLVLGDGDRRALLWVHAVEDVVEHAPASAPAGVAAAPLVAAWSGAEAPLAVLDVARLVALACAAPAAPEETP